ncbi:MAG TPA: YdeI/OmpD-associated family protein [Chitinophagaceae bacterium]
MPAYDPRIDAYIQKAAPFAQPILEHLRELVHKACPQVQETMKWSFPHFEYKGILCSMAAFKQHCSFGFWKAALLKDEKQLLNRHGDTGMGHFGKISSLKDLPSDKILTAYIQEAVHLNEDEIKLVSRTKAAPKKEPQTPPELLSALKKNKAALKTFENFSPSHKREYVEWITEAKTEATRDKRIATTIEWLTEGKIRNWKYVR